jgi:hypothetical protein
VKLVFVAFLGVGLAVLAGLWLDRRLPHQVGRDPGVEANARLIGYASMVLLIPLVAEVGTGVRLGLLAHALIGFLLLPPLLLKLGSVGYRFARYYTGHPGYLLAGPPDTVMRLLGPALVLLTLVLFATGIELWLFGFRFGSQWAVWHKVAFVLWFLAVTVHIVAYWRRASGLALADSRTRLKGVGTRRSLVVASLILGASLLIAMLPFPSPFTLLPGSG